MENSRKKSASQITVVEICDKVDINRSTFYQYYSDTVDLFEQLKADFWGQTLLFITDLEEVKGAEAVTYRMLQYIRKNSFILCGLRKDHQCVEFLEGIYEMLEVLFYEKVRQNYQIPEDFPEVRLKFMIRFITAGCYDVYLEFLNNTCNLDSETAAKYIVGISDVCFASCFHGKGRKDKSAVWSVN